MEKFKKIRKISTIAYVIIAFACLFLFLFSRNRNVSGTVFTDFSVASGEEKIVLDSIKLSPGIYKVRTNYEQNTNSLYGGFFYVLDDNLSENALRCSGSPVYDGLNTNEFTFYLLEPTDSLKLDLVAFDTDIRVFDFVIVNTGKQWLVLLTYITFIYLLSLLAILYFQKDSEGKISKENKIAIVALTLISIVSVTAALCNNTLSTADNGYHMQRIEGVAEAILSGQIPVRIEPHWVQGYGYASAIFYCDLFLVFPAILRIIGFSVTTAYNAYLILINIATVLIAYKVFKEIFQKQTIALLGVFLYTFSSMHFFKLIQTGAIGEGTAMCFLPLVALGIFRIFYTDTEAKAYKTAYLPLSLGFVGIISCHVLSSEITALFVLLICILNIPRFKSLKVFRELIKAAVSAFLMCAWFIIPFLDYYLHADIHVKHVFARTIQEFGYDLSQMYLFIADGKEYIMGIGPVLFGGLIIFAILFVLALVSKNKKELPSMRFALHFFIMAVIMMIFSLDFFPWNKIQSLGGFLGSVISSIQFPNRFLGWAVLSAVMVFLHVCVYFEKKNYRKDYNILFSAAIILTLFSFLYLNDSYLSNVKQYYIANSEGIGNGYISGGEYILQGTDEERLHYKEATPGANVHYSDFEKDNLKITLKAYNENDSEGCIDLPLLAYKGYKAKDENGNALKVGIGENNTLRIFLNPNYEGKIKVSFVSPVYWRIAEIISLATALLILYFEYFKVKKKQLVKQERESLYIRIPLQEENEKALKNAQVIFVFIGAFLIFTTPAFVLERFATLKDKAILFAGVIAFFWACYALLELIFKKEKLIAAFGALSILLSPISIYVINTKGALGDWMYAPAKLALIFNFFVHEGAGNIKLYLAHPIQITPLITASLLAFIYVLVVKIAKNEKPGKEERTIGIFMAISFALVIVSALPINWTAIGSGTLGIISPAVIIGIANIVGIIGSLLFLRNLKNSSDKKTAVTIIAILVLVTVCMAAFHVNDIFTANYVFDLV